MDNKADRSSDNTQQDNTVKPTQMINSNPSGIGPMIAIIIILAVIIIGGLYFWLNRQYPVTPEDVQEPQENELVNIESELHTEEFDSIEEDLDSIDNNF